MTKLLFNNFDEVSAKQWKQKIQSDLKGADYNETLIYKSLEGIDVKPFYHQEDIEKIKNPISHPSIWKNAQEIEVNEAVSGNQKALAAIKKGAESIYFLINNENIEPKYILQNITPDILIYIETTFLSAKYIQKWELLAKETKTNIYILTDIIGNLARTGNWYKNLNDDHQVLEEITKNSNHLQSVISIDTSLYQNAGATMIQQLAYGLAHANEYLNHFSHSGSSSIENHIVFKVAVGGNYFFEIAKLRALKVLWSSLAKEYKTAMDCHIIAHPSRRNKTISDYNVNMLRTTTECMSAVLGGANTIYNLRYDDIYHEDNEFGSRISMNQLLILKNESYFDLVSNPASGSYYIESLTHQLAEKALTLFKNIEKGGGYLTQLKSGIIQKKIKESADKEQELFDNEKIILTGANKYKNLEEALPNFQKSPFLEKKSRKTLLSPIIKKRLSEKIEKKKHKH